MADAEPVTLNWPAELPKPRIGIVRDFEPYPRWTKYCRFCEHNALPFEIYDIHGHDWLTQASRFDAVVGIWSCEHHSLEELREKYWVLQTQLQKATFPDFNHALLYENKRLEDYIASIHRLPFARSFISHNREDALGLLERLTYPVLSKMVPASASVGIELVQTPARARAIIERAFSAYGRKTQFPYARQKNYVYFQEFIQHHGYDIRAIVVGNWVFGYYRKVLPGDFRASGMNLVEKRALPKAAMALALQLNAIIKSPMLVVDMLHGIDGRFHIIEYSPVCQMETPEQLHVDGVPGVYIFGDDGNCRFQKGRYWVHELALREFLLSHYLPAVYKPLTRTGTAEHVPVGVGEGEARHAVWRAAEPTDC
jgi:glutathione synthase/RimK-type ligase-like ATP-grasp enzyme